MMVGRKAVTPYRGSPSATRQIVAGSAVKSSPNAPLICKSMKPGARISPAASITSASVQQGTSLASPTATMTSLSTSTAPFAITWSGV